MSSPRLSMRVARYNTKTNKTKYNKTKAKISVKTNNTYNQLLELDSEYDLDELNCDSYSCDSDMYSYDIDALEINDNFKSKNLSTIIDMDKILCSHNYHKSECNTCSILENKTNILKLPNINSTKNVKISPKLNDSLKCQTNKVSSDNNNVWDNFDIKKYSNLVINTNLTNDSSDDSTTTVDGSNNNNLISPSTPIFRSGSNGSNSSFASSYGNDIFEYMSYFDKYDIHASVKDDLLNVDYSSDYTRSKGSLGQVVRSLIDMHDRIHPENEYQKNLYPTIKMFIHEFVNSYSQIYYGMDNKCMSRSEMRYIHSIIYKNTYITTKSTSPRHERKPYRYSQLRETFRSIMNRAEHIKEQAEEGNLKELKRNVGIKYLSDDNLSITIPNENTYETLITFCEELIGITNRSINGWDIIIKQIQKLN